MIGPAGFMAAPKKDLPAYGTALIKCAKRKCKWQGRETELMTIRKKSKGLIEVLSHTCPLCGSQDYYFVE